MTKYSLLIKRWFPYISLTTEQWNNAWLSTYVIWTFDNWQCYFIFWIFLLSLSTGIMHGLILINKLNFQILTLASSSYDLLLIACTPKLSKRSYYAFYFPFIINWFNLILFFHSSHLLLLTFFRHELQWQWRWTRGSHGKVYVCNTFILRCSCWACPCRGTTCLSWSYCLEKRVLFCCGVKDE